jgi:ATP-binding cassette subfamily B protein
MILPGHLPDPLRSLAECVGIDAGKVLLSARADLDLEGRETDAWLVVTADTLAAFSTGDGPGDSDAELLSGPFILAEIAKIRIFQSVGSAFLQVRRQGEAAYSNVIRFSNGLREPYGRLLTQLNHLREGRPIAEGSLVRPDDSVCPACGLPLAAPKAACPRCAGTGGIMTRTIGLMRPYAKSIALLLAMMIAGVALDLLPPIFTRILVDKVLTPRENPQLLPLILLGLVGASAGRAGLNILIGRSSSLIGTRITKELRERLHAKLIGLSMEYYNRQSAGTLMSRVLGDVDYFQGFVVQVAQGFLLNLMLVVGIGAMLFSMDWQLALLVLVPIPFVVMGTMFFWKHIYPRYYRLWDSQSKMAQSLTGLINGIRLVKSFGQEDREKRRFANAAGYVQESKRSLEMSSATFNPIMGFIFGLGGLIIWYAGGHRVLEERMTLGTLMAFFGYMGMFYAPISALSLFSNWVTGFVSAGQRVFEVLDSTAVLEEPQHPLALADTTGAIEFRNVTFGYDPYSPVLKNVSLKIAPGQFAGIVGKSGSGKTTVVNLICRFYDIQEGEILIDGVNVKDLRQEDLRRHIGLVLQEPFLFRATISENIAYGRPDAGPLEIMNAAKAASAHDFVAKRPAGYDTRLGENGAGLSGGERQRLSIARALLCDPRILILDEATSSVDTESEQEIQKALSQVCRDRTAIAIAHRLSTLRNADIIFVMDDGRVAESGSHEELMAIDDGIYRKLVTIQTELARLEQG